MTNPEQLFVLMGGVLILLMQAFFMNRLAGIPYPLWSSRAAVGCSAKPEPQG